MTPPSRADDLARALRTNDASVRQRAALAAGSAPDDAFVGPLIERSGHEPDFFVRDTLTWALTRLPVDLTVPALVAEVRTGHGLRCAQSLHTLSKIGDPRAWSVITPELLHHDDPEIARTAWRTAVAVVPDSERTALATELVAGLGTGDRAARRSLARALAALAPDSEPVLTAATTTGTAAARAHAAAALELIEDPDADFASVEDEMFGPES